MEPSAVPAAPDRSMLTMAAAWARWLLLASGVAVVIGSVGIAFQLDWATDIWPWSDVRMTYIFFASIGLAIAVPLIWIAAKNELAALEPFALEIGVGSLIICAFFGLRMRRHDEPELTGILAGSLLTGALMLGVYWWSRSMPLRDQRVIPQYVRVSFLIFLLVLVPVGTALVLQVEQVFPWELLPQTSTVTGVMFLGAALLFAWIWLHPTWAYAAPALASFLAYDMVLYVPYVDLLLNRDERPSIYGPSNEVNTNSLIVYLAVLGFSTVVAVYALFIDRRTRVWGTPAA